MVFNNIKLWRSNFFFVLKVFLRVHTKTVFRILIRGSNHPKRLHFLSSNKIKRFHTLWPFAYPVIFLGDSHAEFLSRSSRPGIFAWWIGPHTVSEMTRLIAAEFDSGLGCFVRELVNAGFRPRIVISVGTVDIRMAIFELKLRGLLRTDDDIRKYLRQQLIYFFDEIKKKMHRHFPADAVELVALKVASVDIEGRNPKSISELMEIKQNEQIPILGTIDARSRWADLFNDQIDDLASKLNYRSIGYGDFKGKAWMSADGTHLTNLALVEQLLGTISVDS